MLAGNTVPEPAPNKARELDPSNAQTQQNLSLLATAKAAREPAAQTTQPVQADAGNATGPRLVAVAPSVFELQAPTSAGATEATPQPQPQPQPHLAAMPASVELRGVRLEVSNGAGITRLARRTADRLATEGVKTARLTNAKPYRQTQTEIQYLAGQEQAAQALQARLPVATLAVPADRLNARVQLRLVLGHDIAGNAITAWLDADEKPQVATSQQGGGWRWS